MKTRVASYHADRTNQKLYFCRVYCQLSEQSPDGQMAMAHLESAIMHLYGAYLAFLHEISNFYGISITQPTLSTIQAKLAAKTQVSPEIQRLQQVVHDDFLGDIEMAWQQVFHQNPSFKERTKDAQSRGSDQSDNKLPVVDVMAQALLPTSAVGWSVDLVRQWRTALLTLIEDLREGMVEY